MASALAGAGPQFNYPGTIPAMPTGMPPGAGMPPGGGQNPFPFAQQNQALPMYSPGSLPSAGAPQMMGGLIPSIQVGHTQTSGNPFFPFTIVG